MEGFCAPNALHSKYRASSSHISNGYYQTTPCGRALRQNDYNLGPGNRTSALLWQEHKHHNGGKSRGRMCSIALALASFFVLVAVLSIAGLAVYMGALHNDSSSSMLSFSCSAKVLRGDKFTGDLQEKARRFRIDLETLYHRSAIGAALVSCQLERFGDDSTTMYFKLTLNRKKIPRTVANIEKTLREILLGDALSKRPVFRNVHFDPKNVFVRKTIESDAYQRNQSKESLKTKNGVVLKPKIRPNLTLTANLPVKTKTAVEKNAKNGTAPSVVHGSFTISKTEADITEKKTLPEVYQTTQRPKNITTTRITKRTTIVTSTTPQIQTSTIKKQAATSAVVTLQSTTTTTTAKPTTNVIFSPNPEIFDQQPWIPIRPSENAFQDHSSPIIPTVTDPAIGIHQKQPFYTSFTNPGLSFRPIDAETLGVGKVKGHPIPINKIADIAETSIDDTPVKELEEIANEQTTVLNKNIVEDALPETDKTYVKIETLKYVPGSTTEAEGIQLKPTENVKNISSIFHSLASSLGIPSPTNLKDSDKFLRPEKNETEESESRTNHNLEEETMGHGQVEVVEADEASLILQATKAPLVTLLPAKSNSGIARPLRPRPKTDEIIENRSFPSGSNYKNSNTEIPEKAKAPTPIVQTEVVTSVSSEVNRVKLNKTQLGEFKITGTLNFAADSSTVKERELRIADAEEVSAEEFETHNATRSKSEKMIVDDSHHSGNNILTAEKLAQIAEINKLSENGTGNRDETVISTKAISSTYTVNHSGFKILTKTFNKIQDIFKDEKKSTLLNSIPFSTTSNKTECSNFTVKCGDGQCLPATTRCNQLVDCNDAADEKDCNCSDYLRSQFLLRKICDGIVDCWDFSDENHCEWCKVGQYVCGNSKVCIDKTRICDGVRDCPQGDDERQCVTIAPNLSAADEFPYSSEGYLMVRKHGQWGKLCVQNFEKTVSHSKTTWEIADLGRAVCKALTYQNLQNVTPLKDEPTPEEDSRYYELTYASQNETKSNLFFKEATCDRAEVVKVKCQSLECGARPQVVKHIARIVGGGNAAPGAWPWLAALYKEGEFQCGATLISERWLLSAGHCFFHSLEEHWVARLGALRRGSTLLSPYEQLRPISRIVIHPGYVDAGFVNDISLLQMESAVTFSDYVRPICLPSTMANPKDGSLCTVVGWGQLFEVGRIFPDTLQEVQVPLISTSECRKRTVFLPLYSVTDDMFCAGFERGGRDACLGDSGGPLMCPEYDGRWVLQGVTSNGYGCARANRPGVYTKVSNYVPWIRAHIDFEDLEASNSTAKTVCQGHRCPLGECLPRSRLCNGFIECSDGSDEKDCL